LPDTLVQDTTTTIGSWGRFIARGLDQNGLDGKKIFLDEGIDLFDGDRSNARFPVDAMSRVWVRAVKLSGDEGLALALVEHADPSMLSGLGLSMVSSRTLGDAINRSCLYSQVATDAARQVLRERPDGRLELVQEMSSTEFAGVTEYAVEAFIIATVQILRLISNGQFALQEVHFRHNKNALRERYESFFDAPLVFDSTEYKLIFSAEIMAYPCGQANPALAESIDAWMQDYLGGFESSSLATKVRRLLTEKLPSGEFLQENIAGALAMSARSLQRGLQGEGVNYKELLEKTREDLAIKYIGEAQLPLIEVCCLLGFTDQSNFTKAFKRWTGKTPHAFRQENPG
jgi:AraC-like DNA-binding protein